MFLSSPHWRCSPLPPTPLVEGPLPATVILAGQRKREHGPMKLGMSFGIVLGFRDRRRARGGGGGRPPRLRLDLDGRGLRFRRPSRRWRGGAPKRPRSSWARPSCRCRPARPPPPWPYVTLDHLSQGRFLLGIGASGPQVVEEVEPALPEAAGPHARVRRDHAAHHPPRGAGRLRRRAVPAALPGRHGPRQAAEVDEPPLTAPTSIYLAAEGPKNVAMAGELCDGWLPLFFSPKEDAFYRKCRADGFAASGDPARPKALQGDGEHDDRARRRRGE